MHLVQRLLSLRKTRVPGRRKHHVPRSGWTDAGTDVVLHSPQSLIPSSRGTTSPGPDGPTPALTWCFTPRNPLFLRFLCTKSLVFFGASTLRTLLMCDKEAIEVQKILPFLSDTWPLCRIGRAVIRASQSCRQSCNKSQCPACGCRSRHSCTHARRFSQSSPARGWGSIPQRQGAFGRYP